MKKIIFLLLTILLCLLISIGCARKTADIYSKNTSEETPENSSEETSTEITEEDVDETTSQEFNEEVTSETMTNPDRLNGIDVKPVNHNDVKIWPDGIELGFSPKFAAKYDNPYFDLIGTDDKEYEFIDDTAVKEISISILGKTYTLDYLNSANMPNNDFKIHVYKVDETEKGKVFIDSQTGQVVKYIDIPFENNLLSEEDYVKVVKDIVADGYDFEKSQYSSITWYSDGSKANEFKQLEDGEGLRWRDFYFTRYVDGIKTNEHVSAIFSFISNTISVEIFNFNYEEETFDQTNKHMDELEEVLKEYISNSLIEGYKVNQVDFVSHHLFVKDKVVYVYTSISIEIQQIGKSYPIYEALYITSTLTPKQIEQ